ncbi:g1177 [Coccomyxa elongata]
MREFVLTASQAEACTALDDFFHDGALSFAIIRGPAGAGKSALLQHYFKRSHSFDDALIIKLAPTHQAKSILDNSLRIGEGAKTLSSFFGLMMVTHPQTLAEEFREPGKWVLVETKTGEQLQTIPKSSEGTEWRFLESESRAHKALDEAEDAQKTIVVVVDEISMISEADHTRILSLVDRHPGLKLVLLGDHMQLPPVDKNRDAGVSPCFSQAFMSRDDVKVMALTQIVRQCDEVVKSNMLYMRTCIRKGTAIDLKQLQQTPCFKLVPSLYDHLDEFNGTNDVKALAWRNKTVDALNTRIKERLNGESVLDNFVPNDSIVFTLPYRGLINNGDAFVIRSIEDESVEVYSDRGKPKCFALQRYTLLPAGDARGEAVECWRFKKPAEYRAEKAKLELRARATDDLKLRQKIISGQLRSLKDHHAFFKVAFSLTVHKAQGSTISTVLIDGQDICSSWDVDMRNRLLYTAISRMRDRAIIAVGKAR